MKCNTYVISFKSIQTAKYSVTLSGIQCPNLPSIAPRCSGNLAFVSRHSDLRVDLSEQRVQISNALYANIPLIAIIVLR
jgi:hypothetical protein